MALTLTSKEIVELTGYKRPSKQIGWLKRHAIPHFVNAAGRPVVTAKAIEPQAREAPFVLDLSGVS